MKVNLLVTSRENFIKKKATYGLILKNDEKDNFLKSYPENTILRGDLKKYKGDLRSLRQLKKYWVVIKWFSQNIPEIMERALKEINIVYITKDTIHSILKADQKISSIAFENFKHDEMCQFFDNALKYMAALLKVTPDEIMNNLQELK